MNKLAGFFRRSLRPWRLAKRRFWLLEADLKQLKIPNYCACCGKNATLSRREQGTRRDDCVIVPYCEPCAAHASRAELLEQGASAGSILTAISSAILLNLSFLPVWAILVISTGLSLLPLAMIGRLGLPRLLGHAARGRAVFIKGQEIVVARTDFVHDLADAWHWAPREITLLQSRFGAWAIVGPLLALLLSPTFHYVFWPKMRVLNFTDSRLTLLVDGRSFGVVEPTSGESPAAGAEFRVPSGRRHVRAIHVDGTVTSDIRVTLHSGSQHLFAPGAASGCLYVERVAYGRTSLSHASDPRIVETYPLESDQRFWVIAPDIEPWFVPERSVQSSLTTGGVVSLLRMGRCR